MYIIAEHVVEGHWENHYDIDPSESGLHPVYSVHRSIEVETFYPSIPLSNLTKQWKIVLS